MAVRHRRGLIAIAALLVATGGGVAATRGDAAGDPPASWTEAAAPQRTPEPSAGEAEAPGETAPIDKADKADKADRADEAPEAGKTARTRAVDDARTVVRRNGSAIRSAPGEHYRPVDAVVDPDGDRHVRFQRTHDGLPVLGGDFVVHSDEGGRLSGATVAQQQAIEISKTITKVSRARAVTAAEEGGLEKGRQGKPGVRKVIDAFDGKPVPAWEVTSGDQVVIVDGTTGDIRRAYREVHTADAGTGHGLQVGDVALGTTRQADGTYLLVDPGRGDNRVRDALNEDSLFEPKKFAEFTDADDVWGDGTRADRASVAVDVHYGMATTWDYLRDTFGRSGIRNDGKGLTAYVHHAVNQANASWSRSCECMMFGDGSLAGKPFTSIDVVAHEMAHGLTYATAGLVNSGESGALNEASSDIFGTLVEFSANNPADPPDYLIGEKTETRVPALRSMDEPKRDGRSASCWAPAVKDLDVHHSSGVANKFFYTLAVGSGVSEWGDSPPCGDAVPVTGIGNERAAQIWYRALTVYMVSNTNFAGAREATLFAAADLYGPDSSERRTVEAAWLAAGVDGSDGAYGTPDFAQFEDYSPSPHIGDPVRMQLSAKDPQGQRVTFGATGLPPGVSIDAAGLITGVPTVKGEYRSEMLATDPDGNTAREVVYWLVKGPAVVHSVSPAVTMQLGAGALGNIRAAVFVDAPDYLDDPYDSFKVTATGVPDGLDVTVRRPVSSTYEVTIAGIPTTAGSGTTVLTAVDADGDQVTASVPWKVRPARLPGLPVGVSVTGHNGSASLAWDRLPYMTGDAQVTGWIVRLSPGTEQTLPANARSLQLTGLDTRKAYTVGVRARSAIGDGPEKTLTLTPTGLPLSVSPGTVTWGKPATLSGKVLRSGSSPVAGAVLTLEQRPVGRTTWSRVTTVKTDGKGVWRASVKPAVKTAYRVIHAGSSGMWPATSATPSAAVRYAVTVKASTTKHRANKKIKISGTAKPARSGVKVTLQRKVGSRWVAVTSVKTTAKGTYSFSRAFKRGTWTLRVIVAGGGYNATAGSASVKLKVR
ncbi:M4 family metallopeptidase [Actinoplanes sp. GCM10030250]|uniref:M4 family metallopeptidase n=1 Tax=Actinoplanes sp. GCM10030250 TaxID=3273376 RepID=UPI003608BB5E